METTTDSPIPQVADTPENLDQLSEILDEIEANDGEDEDGE